MTETAASSSDRTVGDFTSRGAVPRVYGEALVELARNDPRVVCLVADLSPATETDLFRDTFPKRFHNLGIAEANMMGVAGGMARCGERPFVHTFSVFATRRSYDQVAMQIAYPSAPVTIVGFLPGLTTLLGVTHQAIDDIALMRALPGMTVIEPADMESVRAAVHAAVTHPGPVYLRMRRAEGPLQDVFTPRPLTLGRAEVRRTGGDAVVFACGLMVDIAEIAAERLARQGRSVAVIDMHTIKPLDVESVRQWATRTGNVVTAENHSIVGGLGSAVAETLMEAGIHARFRRVGVRDTFAEGGSTPYLFRKYGLDADAVEAALAACWGEVR
jgi:transketolase